MLSAVCLNQKKCVPGEDLGRVQSASGKRLRVNVGLQVSVCQSVPGCKSECKSSRKSACKSTHQSTFKSACASELKSTWRSACKSTHKSAWRSTCKSAYKSAQCARHVPVFVLRILRHPGCAGGCKGEGAARLKRKASKTNELRDPSSPRCRPTTDMSWHGKPMTIPSTWPRRHRP